LEAGNDIWYMTPDTDRFSSVKNGLENNYTGKFLNLNVLTETIWARDWSPLMSVPTSSFQGTGIDLKMLDLNYYINRQIDNSISRQINSNIINNADNRMDLHIH